MYQSLLEMLVIDITNYRSPASMGAECFIY